MDIPLSLPQSWLDNSKPGVISTLGEPCEPFGELSFFKMIDVFYDKAYALDEDGATSFILNGITELSELRAAVLACRQFEKPVIVILGIDSDADETIGGKELGYLITLQSLGITAIGFEMDPGSDPAEVRDITEEIMKFSSIPIYVKLDESNAYPVAIKKYEKYSKVVFDCAGLDGQRLEAVNKIISELSPVDTQPEDTSFVAANHLQAFFLNPEHITFSPPIDIECDMADELIDFDDEVYDVINVEINFHDDGFRLSQNLHWLELPVMFTAQTAEDLRMALYYYNGRALVDSKCPVDKESLREISDYFGAIVY